jgi:Flp pilus assembly pilin Flp
MFMASCRRLAARLGRLRDREEGQDLIEYALLTSLIAVAGILVFPAIRSGMADAYRDWNADAQAIWEPAAPSVAPPPM